MADELAEELAASRAALEADRASAKEFERATARARSSATFFQSLYEAPADDDSDDSEASASGSESGGSGRRGRARGAGSSSSSSSTSPSSSSSVASAMREAALSSGPAPPGRSPVRFAVWLVAAIALTGALRLFCFLKMRAREEEDLTTKNARFPSLSPQRQRRR